MAEVIILCRGVLLGSSAMLPKVEEGAGLYYRTLQSNTTMGGTALRWRTCVRHTHWRTGKGENLQDMCSSVSLDALQELDKFKLRYNDDAHLQRCEQTRREERCRQVRDTYPAKQEEV